MQLVVSRFARQRQRFSTSASLQPALLFHRPLQNGSTTTLSLSKPQLSLRPAGKNRTLYICASRLQSMSAFLYDSLFSRVAWQGMHIIKENENWCGGARQGEVRQGFLQGFYYHIVQWHQMLIVWLGFICDKTERRLIWLGLALYFGSYTMCRCIMT